LVFPLVLNPQLHTPCISSPNHHHLFAAHANTNAACSAAISMLQNNNIAKENMQKPKSKPKVTCSYYNEDKIALIIFLLILQTISNAQMLHTSGSRK